MWKCQPNKSFLPLLAFLVMVFHCRADSCPYLSCLYPVCLGGAVQFVCDLPNVLLNCIYKNLTVDAYNCNNQENCPMIFLYPSQIWVSGQWLMSLVECGVPLLYGTV